MSLTDLDVIKAVRCLYGPEGTDPAAWLHLDRGADDNGVYWAVRAIGGALVVIFRGSETAEDWARDLEAIPFYDRDLGLVHQGFFDGVRKAWATALPIVCRARWVAAGHSLGAARAAMLAALGVIHGVPPTAVILFGEPRPGGQKLASVLGEVPLRSYRNGDDEGHDLVTDVPPPEPIPFRHAGFPRRPLIDVCAAPASGDLSPFRYHHAALYEAAIAALPAIPTI